MAAAHLVTSVIGGLCAMGIVLACDGAVSAMIGAYSAGGILAVLGLATLAALRSDIETDALPD